MKTTSLNVSDYIHQLPEDRQMVMHQLMEVINANLPAGFSEEMSYGMIGYVVPHSLYPKGYHCNPQLPLPFLSIASQKNFIGFYHMGMYANEELYNWFVSEYPKHCSVKLDMGKSCVRFKKLEHIPFELIAQLVQKMTPQDWITLYEKSFRKD